MDDREELVKLGLASSVVWMRDEWDPDDRGGNSIVVHSNEQAADRLLQSEWFKNRLREERDLGLELAKVAAYMYGMDDSKWRALVKMQHGSAIVKAIDEEKQRYEEWLENHDTE